jgi:hypothetical protein
MARFDARRSLIDQRLVRERRNAHAALFGVGVASEPVMASGGCMLLLRGTHERLTRPCVAHGAWLAHRVRKRAHAVAVHTRSAEGAYLPDDALHCRQLSASSSLQMERVAREGATDNAVRHGRLGEVP